MKLSPFLSEEKIFTDFVAKNKLNFFVKSVDEIVGVHSNYVKEDVLDLFLKREETMSTGIGKGIAIPHITYALCKSHEIFIFKLKKPIDFNALDKKLVSMVFMVIGNQAKSNLLHLQILAKLARLLKNDKFVKKLLDSKTKKSVLETIEEYE